MLLLLSFVAFIGLGLPDGLLGVAWPSIREAFGLPLEALGSLLAPFFGSYVLASFASGALLARMTVGALITLSCFATSVALFGFAVAPGWFAMMGFAVIGGLGAGAVDVGVNAYVAANHGPRTLNWMHAAYGTGAALGPIVMTSVLGAGRPWQLGYGIVGAGELLLAVAFGASLSLWPRPRGREEEGGGAASIFESLALGNVWPGVAAFFVYTGLEAVTGVWAYSHLTAVRGLSMAAAGLGVTLFWASLTIGRVAFGAFAERETVSAMLRYAVVALAVIGLACGPVFPTLMSLTPARVGDAHASNAVGFQVAAAATGQSLLPTLVGSWAGRSSLAVVPFAVLAAAIVLWILYERLNALSRAAARDRAALAAPAGRDASAP